MSIPGVKIKDLKFVRSHSQAISQCQRLINKYKLEPIIAEIQQVVQNILGKFS